MVFVAKAIYNIVLAIDFDYLSKNSWMIVTVPSSQQFKAGDCT